MTVRIARVYDGPVTHDGALVMVDRLWPRGISKKEINAEHAEWLKDVAPSTQLREWFGHDPSKFAEFERRYQTELAAPPARQAYDELCALRDKGASLLPGGVRGVTGEFRRGDVIEVPTGRRSGLAVVLDPGVDPDGSARPLVVTAGRWAGRLSAADFRGRVPALGRVKLGCTNTPSMRACGRFSRARCRMVVAADCTACRLPRFKRTPSTSDLCGMSGEKIFTATLMPCSSSGWARSIASCGSRATITSNDGMP